MRKNRIRAQRSGFDPNHASGGPISRVRNGGKNAGAAAPDPIGTRDGAWFVIVRLSAAFLLARVALLPARSARGSEMGFFFHEGSHGGDLYPV